MSRVSAKINELLKRHAPTIKKYFPTRPVNWFIRQYCRGFGYDVIAKDVGIHPDVFKVRPGHYYSVFPDIQSIHARKEQIFNAPSPYGGSIPNNIPQQLKLAGELRPYIEDYPYHLNSAGSRVEGTHKGNRLRYSCSDRNTTFQLDSVVLQAMLRHFMPKRVVEVGSGYSSAIILDTREREAWDHQELTFIEPYSQDYFFPLLREDDLNSINLIELPVWEVEDSVFAQLEPNDLLFIDSSHVAKIGSDVHHYVFNIFPKLQPGVIIHIHDITPNFECAPTWFEKGWFWNENSFIKAFLMYNNQFEILFHSSYLRAHHGNETGLAQILAYQADTFKEPNWQWMNSFYIRRI